MNPGQYQFGLDAEITLKPTRLRENAESWGAKVTQLDLDTLERDNARLRRLENMAEIPNEEYENLDSELGRNDWD